MQIVTKPKYSLRRPLTVAIAPIIIKKLFGLFFCMVLMTSIGYSQQTTTWTSSGPSVWESITSDGLVRVECRVSGGATILGAQTMGCTSAATYSDPGIFGSPSLEISASSTSSGTIEFYFFNASTGDPVHIVNPILHVDKVGTFAVVAILSDAATGNFDITNGTWTELSSNGPIFRSTTTRFNIDDQALLVSGGGECGNGTNTGGGGGSMRVDTVTESLNMDVEVTGGLLSLLTASDEVEFVLSNLIIAEPSVEITKTVIENFGNPVSVGDTVDYSISIENTGNVTIDNLRLTDTFTDADSNTLSLTSGPTFNNATLGSAEGTLRATEVATYFGSYTLTTSELVAGGVINQITVLADSPYGTDDVNDISDDGDDTDGNTETDSTESFFPYAVDDSATVCETGSVDIAVLVNDDFGGNSPSTGSIFIVTPPSAGNAVVNDNATPTNPTDDSITYTSDPGYVGSDTFVYGISDAKGYSQHATVSITERPLPDAGSDGAMTVCQGDTVTAAQLFAALNGTPDAGGSWSPAPAGAGTYTYSVDGGPCTASSNITVTVEPQPNAGSDALLEICPGEPITQALLLGLLNTNDPSGTWSPNPEGAGPGIYTYTVTGSTCAEDSATVTIRIAMVDTDGDTITDCDELIDGTDPLDDCDSIGGIPLPTSDCDNDELTEEEEALLGTEPTNPDTDGDGVIDGQEVNDGTDPLDICDFLLESQTVAPSNEWSIADCDQDELTNQEEMAIGTNPNNPDTDGDTITDGQEAKDNTDPLDPCDSIGGTPPVGATCEIYVELDLVQPGDIEHGNFEIINIHLFQNNEVKIYNRWGILVWETTRYDNRSNAFDGVSKGRLTVVENQKLPSGVYFYEIKYVSNGQEKSLSGYLYLIR